VDRLLATKSEGVGLIVRAISFQDFQLMRSQSASVTNRRTDGRTVGQTDGRHAIARPRFALKCTYCALRGKNHYRDWNPDRIPSHYQLGHFYRLVPRPMHKDCNVIG